VLGDDDVALYEARARDTLGPAVAAWLEGGRHRTGDPRLVPDPQAGASQSLRASGRGSGTFVK